MDILHYIGRYISQWLKKIPGIWERVELAEERLSWRGGTIVKHFILRKINLEMYYNIEIQGTKTILFYK